MRVSTFPTQIDVQETVRGEPWPVLVSFDEDTRNGATDVHLSRQGAEELRDKLSEHLGQ